MEGKFKTWQHVFSTAGNGKDDVLVGNLQKYTGGFYTMCFENGGGVKARESGICPTREEAEQAIPNRKR